jgi:hypothetical protein
VRTVRSFNHVSASPRIFQCQLERAAETLVPAPLLPDLTINEHTQGTESLQPVMGDVNVSTVNIFLLRNNGMVAFVQQSAKIAHEREDK